jgi:hypothetical protein
MWRSTIVQAADTWLIWYQFSVDHADALYPGPDRWEIYDAQDDRGSCVKALERIATEHVTNAKGNPDNRVTAKHSELSRIVITQTQRNKGQYSTHYLCVPVGVDPNRDKLNTFYLNKKIP